MTAPLRLPPGIHTDVPPAEYHLDCADEPSLSSSVAKLCYRKTMRHAFTVHPRLNPDYEPDNDSKFDVGSVAHELLLGRGGGFEILDFADWRSGDAKKARIRIAAEGRTAILAHQHADACMIAEAVCGRLKLIPECEALFKRTDDGAFKVGNAEVVLIWRDVGGPFCRCMLDWWGPTEAEVFDIKTTGVSLADASLERLIPNMDYDLSLAFYKRGIERLRPDLAGRIKYRWIFVEDEPPFECRVIEATGAHLSLGDRKAALAIEKWRRCIAANTWPGYPPAVARVEYPPWAEKEITEREMVDDDSLRMVVSGQIVTCEPQRFMEPV